MEELEEIEKQLREKLKNNAFMQHNCIELESVAKNPDQAVVRLQVRPESCNPYGIVHGGAIYAMADNAAGTAASLDGRYYVTQTSAMHFLRNQSVGVVQGVGTVRHRGHATCLVSVDITGDNGKLIATGEFTFFCVDRSVLEKKVQKENGR